MALVSAHPVKPLWKLGFNPRESERDMTKRRRAVGHSLVEYALPAAGVLVVAGVLATSVDITQHLSGYFVKSGGSDKSALSGSTLTIQTGAGASGSTDTGAAGFDNLGQLRDGVGGSIRIGGRNFTYSGPVSRGSRPQGLGGNGDRLYQVQGTNPMFKMAMDLEKSGASQEYVSRVLQMAMTTEQAGNAKMSGNAGQIAALTASQRAQMAGINGYAMGNMGEVQAHGGLTGLTQINGAGKTSIDAGQQLQEFFGRMAQDDTMGSRMTQMQKNLETMLKTAGQNDLDINSPAMQEALKGSGLSEAQLAGLTKLLSDLGVKNAAGVVTGGTGDGSENLMNASATNNYVQSNFYDHSKDWAIADYKASMPAQ